MAYDPTLPHKNIDGVEINLTAGEIAELEAAAVSWKASEPQRLWQQYQSQAQALLDKSDLVAMRCFKAGVAFNADWQYYVSELRAIIKAVSGDATAPLPVQPPYIQGT